MILIEKIELPVPGLDQMRAEAASQGFPFLDSLVEDWQTGANRFNRPGEILMGHFHQGQLIAVGGLNIDPYLAAQGTLDTGRIRRVYVMAAWRSQGVGCALMQALIQEAGKSFRCVHLRAVSERAARLYERLGFVPLAIPSATHILHLDRQP